MMRVRWGRLLVHLIAWAVGLIWIIPFMGILMASIRPHREIVHGWWQLSEVHLSFENYLKAWSDPTASIREGMRNSLIVAIPSTLLPLLFGALAGYGFLRIRFPGRDLIFTLIVLLMAIPQQMVAIPLFRILLDVGLLNTFPGLILAHTAWGLPWITMFMQNYMSTLPMELEEAASLDGANRFQIFYKIVLPLTLPALASIFALQFTWVWNDFFMALLILHDPRMLVITQRIPVLRGQYHIDWGLLTAASVLAMSLPILVFVILQKYYIRGLIGWTMR